VAIHTCQRPLARANSLHALAQAEFAVTLYSLSLAATEEKFKRPQKQTVVKTEINVLNINWLQIIFDLIDW
jgi:hypothetical protein